MTPHVLGTLSTFFRFLHFLHWFSFKSAQRAPFGFQRSLQQSGGHPDRSIHTGAIISHKYAFLKFPIFQNQEKSRKSSRKGPYTLLWSLEGPSSTLVDMQTAQDTLVSAFFVTDVRHAFVSVHILLEWEISRKSSGKAYFTAVLGVRIQPRTLWWISILFRTPWQPHSESGGTHFLQKMSASALQGTVTHARNPPTPPHTYSVNTATAGTTVSNEQLSLFEKPATAKRFVDMLQFSIL